MPTKNLTLGLLLLLAGSAVAQNKTYRIKEGDTLSGIAHKFHVRQKTILQANDLSSSHRLKVGHVLRIPNATVVADHHSGSSSHGSTYTVRNGDCDWVIAKRYSLTLRQLHAMNSDVDWSALQIGTKLHVPGGSASSSSHESHEASYGGPTRLYAVQDGENDWTIARKAGISARVLRKLNPSVRWDRVQVGQKIRLPGSNESRVAARAIHSRYAVIAGDSVSIRRGPGSDEDRITTVDSGTKVVVLDREGEWYKLRFPKGTEGWVRGDLLKAVKKAKHAPVEVAQAAPSHRERARRHRELVAEHKSSRHHFSSTYVAMDTVAATSTGRILNKAQSMRGVRYHWGEMSRSGTDCSGFTSQVFRSVGVRLPRVSRDQATVGQRVGYGGLKAGDLVFFHTMRGNRITHVGIYMGNGKFIHASSGGGKVQVNSLTEGYYRNRFVTGRRVVKTKKHGADAVNAAKKHHVSSDDDVIR